MNFHSPNLMAVQKNSITPCRTLCFKVHQLNAYKNMKAWHFQISLINHTKCITFFFFSFRTQSRQQYETHLNKHKKWPDRETRRNYKKLSTAVLSKKAWHSWMESRGSSLDPDFKITYNHYDYSAAWPVAFNIKDWFGSRCMGGVRVHTCSMCNNIYCAIHNHFQKPTPTYGFNLGTDALDWVSVRKQR